MATAKQPAREAYASKLDYAKRALAELTKYVETAETNLEAGGEVDWGNVGSMGYVNENLDNVAAFLGLTEE
ncbi:hypothetical protein ELZ19_06985 [Brucella abortus]|uniref:hypothetical protein n=1 Tax=Brucella abortus TaxID=235 RepID=UPI000AC225CF|nr:hypothetical protein [Brucella abortus]RUQ67315.1 hypothetical protein ELZ23_15415 [Brucella abortus]RUQ78554.1 hypothetical protein ELZ22_16910 [Brucella abortus]RUQ88296.1 hypothetical protein ELZ18_15665 [Brucella abortus]RUQ90326.1 hypothetical protein ELZ20_15665 [Brucella abortus]RUQ96491.1 hypothetical protein ELZ21_15365 [Brucella abortus]